MVLEKCELFFDEVDDNFFVETDVSGVTQVFQIGTKSFVEWLSYEYYKKTENLEKGRHGASASEPSIKQAIFALNGICKQDGDKKHVHLRTARHKEGFVIFLGDEGWRSVEVLPTGWRIIIKPIAKFWKPSAMFPLPAPVTNGNINQLWEFCNISEKNRPLVLAWMLEAFRLDTPFPVLSLHGLQGTAKSSTHDRIRQLVDPNKVNLRTAPKKTEDIFISAGVNWIVSFENISRITASQQDALCILSTGGGYASRTLYTNTEETIILEKSVERGVIVQTTGFTVLSKNFSFTHRLSGYFLEVLWNQ